MYIFFDLKNDTNIFFCCYNVNVPKVQQIKKTYHITYDRIIQNFVFTLVVSPIFVLTMVCNQTENE